MIKKLTLLLLLTVASFSLVVNEVIITGNKTVSNQKIMDVLFTKVKQEFVTDDVIDDISRIYELGLFKDNISAETEILGHNGINVIFVVEENPVIEKIFFVGLNSYTEAELLLSLNCQVGKILNYNDLRNDIQILNRKYHNDGYSLMKIKEIIPPIEDNILTYVLKEGIIEDIAIKGTKFTKEFVVTRELQVKPGDTFNVNVLREDLRSLYNTGYFKSVNVDPPVPGINQDNIILVLNLKENRFGALNFGGGIGSVQGFFGFVKLEFVNVLGEGYNISTKGEWGEKRGTYELKYFNPWFWSGRTSLTARIWNTDGLIDEGQGLKSFNMGGEITVGKPLMKNIRGWVSLRLNNVHPHEVLEHNGKKYSTYYIRSIGSGGSYDSRDNRFNPSTGEYLSVYTVVSNKILGSTIEFTKINVKANKFLPIADNLTLGFKSRLDDAYGTIFDTERYFSGGGTTVRGYADGSPYAKGARRAIGTTELRYSISNDLQLYIFYDVGKVTAGKADVNFSGDSKWRSGKGLGLRISTPIGPLRFDYAWGDGVTYNDGYDSSKGSIYFNIESLF